MSISIPVSWGEFFDKITILTIKNDRITDPDKLHNIAHELALLSGYRDSKVTMTEDLRKHIEQLQHVNEELWQIEDEIRLCEKRKDFGDTFITLARSVYFTNDKRAALKAQINALLGSDVMEEKSYEEY